MAPTNESSAPSRARPRRGRPTILKNASDVSGLFTRLFPAVKNKRRGKWFNPEVGYAACNALRKSSGDAVPYDKRLHNVFALNATANARDMQQSEGSSPGDAAETNSGILIYLFWPHEIDAAKAGNFADVTPRTLISVNTREAADELVRDGWVTFTNATHYDTKTTGLSQLPRRQAAEAPTEVGAASSLGDMSPPEGPVTSLPKKMPRYFDPGSDRHLVDMVIECFEDKVIDEDAKCVRHPIRMWPKNSKDRKAAGYDDSAGYNNRCAMYFAIKCGTKSIEELKSDNINTAGLLKLAREQKKGREGTTYFDLCLEVYGAGNNQMEIDD